MRANPDSKEYIPRVEVIINVHNGEEFLSQAIESVRIQSFTDFSLFILDNASTDGTQEILKSYLTLDKRISVLRLEEKVGLFEARNIAIAETRGELIAFLDSDDLWQDDKLSYAEKALQVASTDIFYSNFIIENVQARDARLAHKRMMPSGNLSGYLDKNYPVAFSSLVIRRSVFDTAGPFNSDLGLIGDFDFLLRASPFSRFSYSPKSLVTVRLHGANLSKTAVSSRNKEIRTWAEHPLTKKAIDKKRIRRATALLVLDTVILSREIQFHSVLTLFLKSGFIAFGQITISKLLTRLLDMKTSTKK